MHEYIAQQEIDLLESDLKPLNKPHKEEEETKEQTKEETIEETKQKVDKEEPKGQEIDNKKIIDEKV